MELSGIRHIRESVQKGVPYSEEECRLSFPCAVEKDGKLYVGYSNDAHTERVNKNKAELAVFLVSALHFGSGE